MDVTNENLLRFYADMGTEETYPITQKYLESHKPSAEPGNYVNLAYAFWGCEQVGTKKEAIENKNFYHWLEDNYASMMSLEALKDHKFLFKKMKTTDPLLQKWHLFVSFYTLEEYWWKSGIEQVSWKKASVVPQWLTKEKISKDVRESPFSILCGSYGCHELLLWMYEAAVLKTKSHELDDMKNQINNGTLDGKTIWKNLAGSSYKYKPVIDKIYNLIEKYYSHSSEGSEA